ncbi:ABC transporter ATP-binding protein [Aerococcaceae bacterium WGS1372]
MAKISLKHIYKDYSDDVRAVTDFNLEIDDEEFIVLVGPSGCGKSTTLRMLAGLEDISSGEILIDGRKQNDLHPKERDIAMVFQNYALYPHMTVFDNLAFGLKMRDEDKIEIKRRVKNAAEILDIEDYLDRKPAELSGGQRQRVALGRAIVREPKVFLMDEPLSNLDAKLRFHTRAEITKLHRRLGVTTIYVTHDQTEAMSMASRIVVMNKGIIQQIGTPREIYMKPNNIFVGQFIGSPAMNFIPLDNQGSQLYFGDHPIQLPKDIKEDLSVGGYGVDKDVIVGIRPESIEVLEDGQANDDYFIFDHEVVNSELMGAETLIYFDVDNRSVISKVQSMDSFTVGERVRLGIHYSKLHFFDKDTELRIAVGEEARVLQAAK